MKEFTDIKGVYAKGIHCGVKTDKNKLDLCLIYVPNAFSSAGVFTRNKFRAACVDYNEASLKDSTTKAILVNSGNANAATGKEGVENCNLCAETVAKGLNIKSSEVLLASTGIIGVQLPIDNILSGIKNLTKEPKCKEANSAAEAILTLDTRTKKSFHKKNELVVSGFAKGAGMISPNMATMLGFVFTNIKLSSVQLKNKLQLSCDKSFNMISVDTDTSTNDLVTIISTGEVEAKEEDFQELLDLCCIDLAKQIAGDGEGAEKLIEANITNAASEKEAKIVAKNIINSPLVKTAIHGNDPNWGRLIMAAGKEPSVKFDSKEIEVYLVGRKVFSNGAPADFNRAELQELLKSEEVKIDINLNNGTSGATAWGCDLTKKYIEINTDYN